MGDLLDTFRRTLAKIVAIEKNIAAEQRELVALRGEIDELRAILRPETQQSRTDEPRAPRRRPIRQSSAVGYAKRILAGTGGGPMHVDAIIVDIEHMTGLAVNKATLVSSLARYVKAGDTFRRTAANTFELIPESEEQEIRLVG